MRLIMVSRSLMTLDARNATTSSQTYELGLARELSHGSDVAVVSLSGRSNDSNGRLSLIGLGAGPRGLLAMTRLLRILWSRSNRGTRVLSFGYDPAMLTVMVLARLNRCVVCPIVFDSHRGSILSTARVRALILSVYFALGWRMLRLVNGAIVVTEAARNAVKRHNENVLLSRVATNAHDEPRLVKRKTDIFTVIYAGALEEYNSVEEILAAIVELNKGPDKFLLHVFGSGSLRGAVESAAAAYPAIIFHGLKSQSIVWTMLRSADVALNVRRLDHVISQFAFPSKLIELMGAGVPVISTPVLPADSIARYGIVLDEVTPEKIAASISRARDEYPELMLRAARAPSFVRANFSWPTVGTEISSFLKGLR